MTRRMPNALLATLIALHLLVWPIAMNGISLLGPTAALRADTDYHRQTNVAVLQQLYHIVNSAAYHSDPDAFANAFDSDPWLADGRSLHDDAALHATLRSLVKALGDPYSGYVHPNALAAPESVAELRTHDLWCALPFGAQLRLYDTDPESVWTSPVDEPSSAVLAGARFIVRGVLPESAAEHAQLQAGDIVRVLSLTEAGPDHRRLLAGTASDAAMGTSAPFTVATVDPAAPRRPRLLQPGIGTEPFVPSTGLPSQLRLLRERGSSNQVHEMLFPPAPQQIVLTLPDAPPVEVLSQVLHVPTSSPGPMPRLIQRFTNRREVGVELDKEAPVPGAELALGARAARNVGYIRITEFTETSSALLRKELRRLDEVERCSAYIIDLRNSPGGMVREAMYDATAFLDGPRGEQHGLDLGFNDADARPVDVTIAYTLDAAGYLMAHDARSVLASRQIEPSPIKAAGGPSHNRWWSSPRSSGLGATLNDEDGKGGQRSSNYYPPSSSIAPLVASDTSAFQASYSLPSNRPVVLLINRGTASAAELFAAALHDNGRAVIVGEASFGKGLIQRVYDLPNGGALRLTIGEYLRPNRQPVQTVRLHPDLQCDALPRAPSTGHIDEASDICVIRAARVVTSMGAPHS